METTANKTIDAGISVKHAKNWTIAEALRELVQNWLDVRNEFNCSGTITWKDGKAAIKDGGPGLEMKHFSFGENDKAEGSIGQFGEGMKSAFIVLVRNGRQVTIRSNGRIVRPVIAVSEAFGIDTLHYEITPMLARHAARLQGTVIDVECSEDELAEGKSYFVELIRQERKGAAKKAKKEGRSVSRSDLKVGFKWLQKGKVSLPGGFVYVKGSLIGTISGAAFSYHLDGIEAAQATNRDRNAVDMDVVEPLIKKIILNTSSEKVMQKVLKGMTTSSESCWESERSYRMWGDRCRVWKRIWNETFGENVALSYNSDSDRQAEYRGWKVIYGVGYSEKQFLSDIGVQDTSTFQPKVKREKLEVVGIRSLTEDESANYKWAVKMTEKHYHEIGKVVIATDLNALAGVSSSELVEGLYRHDNGTIYIRRTQLRNRKETLHTLLHELVHKVSGTSDCTAEFERALLDVAVGMMMKES